MKMILFVGVLLSLGGGVKSCSNAGLNSSIKDANQWTVNNINDVINNLESSFETQTGAGEYRLVYPDYYCGSYVKDSVLAIKVKGVDWEAYKKDLVQRCKSRNFIIEEGVNTMNELLLVRDVVNSKDDMGGWKALGISACGIDPKEGKVVVMMQELSEANINKFKKEVIDSPLVKFGELSFDEN